MLRDVAMCQFTSTSNHYDSTGAMTVLSAPPPVASGDDVVKRRHGVHAADALLEVRPRNVFRGMERRARVLLADWRGL